ncbi:hypothetical protein PENPOL_c010G03226 [Penicillium polonicum]|uniref:Uncharacterized protein n=1 Tax=Penicillium polonicum TaxID=60169 RepID=A0A1V6NE39_PENPO|nr:hypothetical protein PENPOL_c010G03226 [Penicillium polonicum]
MASQPSLQDEGVLLERLLNTTNESTPAETPSTEETKPKPKYPHPTTANTVRFRPQLYVPLLVLIYTGLLLAAWSILCLSSRSLIVSIPSGDSYDYIHESWVQSYVDRNQKWWRAARVMWSVVGVLTLPLASSVCGYAAVGYIQSQRYHKANLTLRQTLNLADRGWTSPNIIFPMLWSPKKHGSASISPLQELLVGQGSVKVPLNLEAITEVKDIFALTDPNSLDTNDWGDDVGILRSNLGIARPTDSYENLWGANATCSDSPFNCDSTKVNVDNLSLPKNVTPHEQILFMSGVKVNTSTGLIRQFAPRFNSSLHWESLDNGEFPSNCSGIAFFRNYTVSHKEEIRNADKYQIAVCMLGNLTETPFKRTRNRQDFNETLFVTSHGSKNVQTTFKLTLSTTLGYFELPNDHLGSHYGPLLDSDPLATCSRPECESQNNDEATISRRDALPERYPNGTYNGTFYLEFVASKGPLALITLALFGQDAFIDTKSHNLTKVRDQSSPLNSICYEYAPLALLLGQKELPCNNGYITPGTTWVNSFSNPQKAIPALNQAAFLANQAILQATAGSSVLYIQRRSHLEYLRPEISTGTIIGLSVLIGVFLFLLLSLCVMTLTKVAWAGSLDSHAIVKMSAALSESLPLSEDWEKDSKKTEELLDLLPGYIGDAEPEAPVGRLAVGAEGGLKWRRRYWKGQGLAL